MLSAQMRRLSAIPLVLLRSLPISRRSTPTTLDGKSLAMGSATLKCGTATRRTRTSSTKPPQRLGTDEGHPRRVVPGHLPVQVFEADVEAQCVEKFQVVIPDKVIEANRREQTLVRAYSAHRRDQGRCGKRRFYALPGSRSPLVCDLIDDTDQVLYEARGDVRRSSVRTAIGQLFDYRRFEPGPMSIAVLLPRKPSEDLIELIHSVGASVVWRTADGFADSQPQSLRIRSLGADEVPRPEKVGLPNLVA